MGNLVDDLSAPPPNKKLVGQIAQLLERQGIDVSEVGKVQRVSVYQTITKDKEGVAEVHDLSAIQFSPSWETGPQWDLIHPTAHVRIPPLKVKTRKDDGFKKAVILPDIQIGYFKNKDGEFEPTHDERAINIALAVIRDTDPDEIILLGDNLDLPEMSKYRHSPSFAYTTQKSLDRAGVLVAQLRAAAPNARVRWLAGNHEERLVNYIMDNAKAAFGIKRANTPESFPVLSIPFLCWFEDHGIEYVPGYPAGNLFLNQNIKIIHGTKVASGGSTAHKYLNTQKVSVVYGHIHRREWAERTRDDWDGPKTIMAASPGCLARCDGSVPSTKGGIDLDGRPITIAEDWQQGLALITYEDHSDHRFFYEQIPIHNNVGFFRGKTYEET